MLRTLKRLVCETTCTLAGNFPRTRDVKFGSQNLSARKVLKYANNILGVALTFLAVPEYRGKPRAVPSHLMYVKDNARTTATGLEAKPYYTNVLIEVGKPFL